MSNWFKSFLNYATPDAPETTDEKLDALLASRKSSTGFAAPSSKSRRVNLSAATRTQKLSKAQQSKAQGFELPDMKAASNRVLASSNPIVRDAIRRAGGTPAKGPRIALDARAQNIPLPKIRRRPNRKA